MMDVLIIGAGPTALSLAAECAKHSLQTQVVAPSPRERWKPNYGLWLDELVDPSLLACVRHQWDRPAVWFGDTKRSLDRVYALFETERLQQQLLNQCTSGGVEFHSAKVVAVDAQKGKASTTTDQGETLDSQVVVDASGPNTTFIVRKGRFQAGYQVAVGYWIEVDRHPFGPGEMALMDYRAVPTFPDSDPSFLYALPVSDRLIFVEETSLVSRPPLNFETLESRLADRLEHMGIVPLQILEKEYCQFPMGLPLPREDQNILAFGAAASMVHPATGYQLAHALRLAPQLAENLRESLDSKMPEKAVENGWNLLWPKGKRQSWELYQFGMDFLVARNAPDTRKFFEAFFQQNEEQWQGYLSGNLPPHLVGKSMKSVFSHLDNSMRWRLIRAGASLKGLPILQAALRKSE